MSYIAQPTTFVDTGLVPPIRTESISAQKHRVGTQVMVPQRWRAVVTGEPGVPGTIRVDVKYDPALHRAVASAVAVERTSQGDEITGLTLREVRVQAFVQASGLAAVTVRVGSDTKTAADFIRGVRDSRSKTADDNIRDAAVVYEIASAISLPPLKTVSEALKVSQSTATRLVNRARDSGLLIEPSIGNGSLSRATPQRPEPRRGRDR